MVGCPPSEWARRLGGAEATSAPPAWGLPSAATVSARQRWSRLVPLVEPAVSRLLGEHFLARMLATRPVVAAHATPHLDYLDAGFQAEERARLIASLRRRDPAIADDLAPLLDVHDFAAAYGRVLGAYELSTTSPSDAVAALAGIAFVAANNAGNPSVEQIGGLARQVRGALGRSLARLEPSRAQDAHTALLCHFVVAYHALEAARASGDPRASEELREAALYCGREAFGGDLSAVQLGADGFVEPTPAKAAEVALSG